MLVAGIALAVLTVVVGATSGSGAGRSVATEGTIIVEN
jgi:hypothetical protein